MKRVMMFAYFYPPIISSGTARPLAFSKYLPEFGYLPVVLTHCGTDGAPQDKKSLAQIPASVAVERIAPGHPEEFTGLVKRWLRWAAPLEAMIGKRKGWLGEGIAWRFALRVPDFRLRRIWTAPCLREAPRAIERYSPSIIWATGPPFDTVKVAAALASDYRIPLVADLRDPWTFGRSFARRSHVTVRLEFAWEKYVMSRADRIIVVTSSMRDELLERFPQCASKVVVITNGFDTDKRDDAIPGDPARMTISHVGILDQTRPPGLLLDALDHLRKRSVRALDQIRLRLVGPVHYSWVAEIARRQLKDNFQVIGAVDADTSRAYMRGSDALLIYESAAHALTGKLFDYLAARRPILAVTPKGAEVSRFLSSIRAGECVGNDSAEEVAAGLHRFADAHFAGRLRITTCDSAIMQYHRRALTKELAEQFDAILTKRAPANNNRHRRPRFGLGI